MFIDTHCHLTFPDFKNDIEAVVSRANVAGIKKIIVPSISLETSLAAIELAERFDQIYATVGVHPQDSKKYKENQFPEFLKLAKHPKVVAVGEIGLDYYRNYAPHNIQKEVLKTFLYLAVETKLPVVIHNRSAFADLIDIIKQEKYRKLSGVFHCFSEGEPEATKIFNMDYFVSFTGTITFKNSRSAQIAQKIPLEKQLLETDAPFMAPVPNRGKRNEPAYIKNIADKQAELHHVEVEVVAQKTTNLAFKIFPKLVK